MKSHRLTPVAVFVALTLAFQVNGKPVPKSPPAKSGSEGLTVVEARFATDHVPIEMKPGSRVDLKQVVAMTLTATGKPKARTSDIVSNIEVVSVKRFDKPVEREQAIAVELRVTKDQAKSIEAVKSLRVKVLENIPGQPPMPAMRPVTLRLELSRTIKNETTK